MVSSQGQLLGQGWGQVSTSPCCSRYFIFFEIVIKSVFPLIFFSAPLSFVFRINFCTLLLYYKCKSLVGFSWWNFKGLLCMLSHRLQIKILTSFFLHNSSNMYFYIINNICVCMYTHTHTHNLLQFSHCLPTSSSTVTVLGKNQQPHLVPDFNVNALSFSLFRLTLAICLQVNCHYCIEICSCIPDLSRTLS